MIADLGCFLGEWPFRSLPAAGLRDMLDMAARHGVGNMAVSDLREVFWEDSFEATRRAAGEIEGHESIVQFQVVNLGVAGWEKDVERGVRDLGVGGFRLVPAYQGYRLDGSGCQDLLAAARGHGLPVAVHVRLQDERMQWVHRFAPAPVDELGTFLDRSQGVRVAVLGGELGEWRAIGDVARGRGDLWADWSRLRAMLNGLDKAVEAVGAESLLYASLWPLQTPSAMLNLVQASTLPPEARTAVLQGNAERFLRGTK